MESRTTTFGRIMHLYAMHKGMAPLSFFLDGNRISPEATLAELRSKDGDLVDVVLTIGFAYWRGNTKRM